ncbi:hypothetical protein GCM10023096_32030 [Nonomuraea ferruginea]
MSLNPTSGFGSARNPDGPRYAALTMPASVTQVTITLLDSYGWLYPAESVTSSRIRPTNRPGR